MGDNRSVQSIMWDENIRSGLSLVQVGIPIHTVWLINCRISWISYQGFFFDTSKRSLLSGYLCSTLWVNCLTNVKAGGGVRGCMGGRPEQPYIRKRNHSALGSTLFVPIGFFPNNLTYFSTWLTAIRGAQFLLTGRFRQRRLWFWFRFQKRTTLWWYGTRWIINSFYLTSFTHVWQVVMSNLVSFRFWHSV